MLDLAEVKTIAEPILREAMSPYGLDEIVFVNDVDHDGDAILRATIHYGPGAPRLHNVGILAMVEAVRRVMELMRKRGDSRFVHVSHHYADGLPVTDDLPARRSKKHA